MKPDKPDKPLPPRVGEETGLPSHAEENTPSGLSGLWPWDPSRSKPREAGCPGSPSWCRWATVYRTRARPHRAPGLREPKGESAYGKTAWASGRCSLALPTAPAQARLLDWARKALGTVSVALLAYCPADKPFPGPRPTGRLSEHESPLPALSRPRRRLPPHAVTGIPCHMQGQAEECQAPSILAKWLRGPVSKSQD